MRAHLGHLNREGEHAWWVSLTGKDERWHRQVAKGWWSGPWRWHRYRFEIEFAIGGEDNMAQLHVALPFVGHVAAGVRLPRSWTRGWIYERRAWALIGPDVGLGRVFTVKVAHDYGLDGMADYYRRKRERGEHLIWSRAATWPGWEWSLHPRVKDRLLGRVRHSKETLRTQDVSIAMPEGVYPATVTLERLIRKRPRWHKAQSIDRWNIDVPDGIPIPGKGENSWDCGDDATYSMSFPAGESTIAEAVAVLQTDVLETRARRGGLSWRPMGDVR